MNLHCTNNFNLVYLKVAVGISTAGGLKEMKKLILILGNGFTIDLLAHLEQQKVNIDLTNLFSKGDTVVWPDGSHERGFLSYKHCPSLWNLGARPNMDSNSANELIEDIITCANMVSSSNAVPKENNIYLSAYYELVAYLKHLFIQYNKEVSDSELQAENIQTWGWLRLIKEANDSSEYDRIIICAYRLYAVERKIDTKVRNIGQQKCYNDLRKRRRSLAWHEQRASRLKNFALASARKRAAGRNYSGFGFQTALSARNAAVRNITQFAGGTRSSAAPADTRLPSPQKPLCTARICP